MSFSTDSVRKVVPAQLGFLAIYNPSLGTTDASVGDQIVYYSTPHSHNRTKRRASTADKKASEDAAREERNEQLRQVGLAQGMVEFGRSFSDGKAVDTVETERSRIVLHELESGWWILAASCGTPALRCPANHLPQSINLTVLPGTTKTSAASKGTGPGDRETTEYSSREVKPAILLLGDLLRAHSTFLLHHASSMSALFVRTRRSKFVGLLGRYWDSFVASWNVLMHGNPANSLYGGIKVAACGELGMGVGEEDRGSGERQVLEGFVGRIEGMVDVIVSKFGDSNDANGRKQPEMSAAKPKQPWLGSGEAPAAEDGVVFLGTGALSRKSLRDLCHWMEDLYMWGDSAYGVVDNPSSIRRAKRPKQSRRADDTNKVLSDATQSTKQTRSPSQDDSSGYRRFPYDGTISNIPPAPIVQKAKAGPVLSKRPSFKRAPASSTSTESESNKGNKFVQYLKLGYGTSWSLGGMSGKNEVDTRGAESINNVTDHTSQSKPQPNQGSEDPSKQGKDGLNPVDDSGGHFLIGLMGDIDIKDKSVDPLMDASQELDGLYQDSRLVLRTMTVELERAEDARAEAEISIDLGDNDSKATSTNGGSEHTRTSNTSYESQDRNKTKRLRVVVYASKPFIFVFLFEVQTDALALTSLYRSLHHQIQPLLRPLAISTAFRAPKPEIFSVDGSATPIYDLLWDPKLLTINSTIPNIPDPPKMLTTDSIPWSRIEALNTHTQIINTYISSTTDKSELERTSKTSRGWWVVWTRIPDPNPPTPPLASGTVKIPKLIAEDSMESHTSNDLAVTSRPNATSHVASTQGSSMVSGPAHPFMDAQLSPIAPRDKEIFLIRRASDYVAKTAGRFASGSSNLESGWASSAPVKLAQGIGVDTKRYIEALLNMNR